MKLEKEEEWMRKVEFMTAITYVDTRKKGFKRKMLDNLENEACLINHRASNLASKRANKRLKTSGAGKKKAKSEVVKVYYDTFYIGHVDVPKERKKQKKNKTMTTARSNEKGKKDDDQPPEALWRLFREGLMEGGECRDIVEKHILPRLNRTDIKFLYDVNSETRALIKRSSRMGKLKRKFKVHKMSSLSALEFAWNNIQWGAPNRYTSKRMDQAWFCSSVAETNKLELLKWA